MERGRDKRGYGRFHFNKRPWLAHRFSYFLKFGSIKDNLLICHSCDNPPCVNPKHLWQGTNLDNSNDKIKKGRARYVNLVGEQHGKHKLTENDVLFICRLCEAGFKQKKIAKWYSVYPSLISKIHLRTVWKWLK